MTNRVILFSHLLLAIVCCTPYFLLSTYIGYIVAAIIVFITLLTSIKHPNALLIILKKHSKSIFLYLIFFIIALINIIFSDTNVKLGHIFFFCSFIGMYFIGITSQLTPNLKKNITWFFIIINLANCIISLPNLFDDNVWISRRITSGEATDEEITFARLSGICNYSYYMLQAVLVPFILEFIKIRENSLFQKLIIFSSVVVILIVVLMSTYFAAFLNLLLIMLIYATYNIKKNGLKILTIITIISIATVTSFNSISKNETFMYVIEKFERMTNGVSNKGLIEGDETERGKLTINSINTFKKNPIMGVGPQDYRKYDLVGGHSFWFDFFAQYGIIFLLFSISVFFMFYENKYADNFSKIRKLCFLIIMLSSFGNPLLLSPFVYYFCFILLW